jgi:hypothetical protein
MGGLFAIGASQPFPPSELTRILIKVNDAFGELKNGTTSDEMFDRMAAVLNVGMVRCEVIGQGGVEVFKAAQQALMSCDDLKSRHGKYGFTGPGITAMQDAIALYSEILKASTPLQMERAQQECIRRIRAGQIHQPESMT